MAAVKELHDMFPSWDESTLADVLASVDGRTEDAVNLLLSWVAEDAAAIKPTSSENSTSIRPHLEPTSPYHSAEHVEASTKKCFGRDPPSILERTRYDGIMLKRLQRHCGGRYLAEVLKVAAHWHHRAHIHHVATRYEGTFSAHGKSASLVATDEELHRKLSHLSREDSIKEGKELLRQRCEFLGVRQHEMVDDGNCQFRAISQELFGSQDYHEMVRSEIVTYLKKHEADYCEYFADDEWKHFVDSMSKTRTWGDEMTLRAAAEAFGIRIHVVTSTEENWLLEYGSRCGASEGGREVFLTYVAPIHYNTIEVLR